MAAETVPSSTPSASTSTSLGGLDSVEVFSLPSLRRRRGYSFPQSPSSHPCSENDSLSCAASSLASRVSALLGIDGKKKKKEQKKDGGDDDDVKDRGGGDGFGGFDDDDDGSFDLVFVHLTPEPFASFPSSDEDNDDDGIDDDEDDDGSSEDANSAASSSSSASSSSAAVDAALSFADSFLRGVRAAPGAVDDAGDDALIIVLVFGDGGGSRGKGKKGGGGDDRNDSNDSDDDDDDDGGKKSDLPLRKKKQQQQQKKKNQRRRQRFLRLPSRGGAPLELSLDCDSDADDESTDRGDHPQRRHRRRTTAAVVVPRPRQSFEFASGTGERIRDGGLEGEEEKGEEEGGEQAATALLVAARCDGVLRVDGGESLLRSTAVVVGGDGDDFEIVPAGNGLGCILAENLLDEVAYKIGRAPKYGA